MWLVHLFFANAKANARVARIASMKKKEKEEKKRKHHESEQHCSHINQSRLELLAREFARLITKIDFIAVSDHAEINIFNCVCEK